MKEYNTIKTIFLIALVIVIVDYIEFSNPYSICVGLAIDAIIIIFFKMIFRIYEYCDKCLKEREIIQENDTIDLNEN